MQLIKQNEANADRRQVAFTAVSSTNLTTRLDPDTLTFVVRIVKSDGTSVAGDEAFITHPDDTNALGLCFYELNDTDHDTLGSLVIRISATGMETREIPVLVVPIDPYDSDMLGLTLSEVTALLFKNAVLDNVVYGAQNVLTSARLRYFASKTAANAATPGAGNNADGEIRRYTVTATDAGGGQIDDLKLVRDL